MNIKFGWLIPDGWRTLPDGWPSFILFYFILFYFIIVTHTHGVLSILSSSLLESLCVCCNLLTFSLFVLTARLHLGCTGEAPARRRSSLEGFWYAWPADLQATKRSNRQRIAVWSNKRAWVSTFWFSLCLVARLKTPTNSRDIMSLGRPIGLCLNILILTVPGCKTINSQKTAEI